MVRFVLCSVVIATLVISVTPAAEAARRRRNRGPSPAQRYQQMQKEYQARLQAQLKANQQRQQVLDSFVLEKFDENRNGHIEGAERGPAEHFLRDLRMGKDASHDAGIIGELLRKMNQVEATPSSATKKK